MKNRVKLKVWKSPKIKFQILGEEDYATVERQPLYDGHTLALCHAAALNTWDRNEEVGKKIESFTKVIQGSKETTHFLQRLT